MAECDGSERTTWGFGAASMDSRQSVCLLAGANAFTSIAGVLKHGLA